MEYKERKEGRVDGKLAPKGHKRRPFQVTEQSTSSPLLASGIYCARGVVEPVLGAITTGCMSLY